MHLTGMRFPSYQKHDIKKIKHINKGLATCDLGSFYFDVHNYSLLFITEKGQLVEK